MSCEFKTTNCQLKILRKRGVNISNGSRVKRILEKENYYNIINGYKELFLDKNTEDTSEDKYLQGTDFDEIYALYLFDRDLRNLFLNYILIIENQVKTVLAYEFSKKYGNSDYLKISNFDTSIKPNQPNQKDIYQAKVTEITNLIIEIQKEIAKQLTYNNPMISHYVLNDDNGNIPLWVLVNKFSLGTVSKFYSNLKESDQNNISKKFNLFPKEMYSFLKVLTLFRNQCAHASRLYNLKLYKKGNIKRPNSICDTSIHSKLHIVKGDNDNYKYGKNDLFAVVVIFKLILSKKDFAEFISRLSLIIEKLNKKISTINIDLILDTMGFPQNWKEIKNVKI